MIPLQAMTVALVVLSGTAAALTRDPFRQTVASGLFGLVLIVLFLVFQAPDVSLSAMVASGVASPLMVLLALAKVQARERGRGDE